MICSRRSCEAFRLDLCLPRPASRWRKSWGNIFHFVIVLGRSVYVGVGCQRSKLPLNTSPPVNQSMLSFILDIPCFWSPGNINICLLTFVSGHWATHAARVCR